MTIELFDPSKPNAAPAGAHLTNNGGPLLDPLHIVGVYLDDFPYAREMAAFLDWYVAGSSLLMELKEYHFSGQATHGTDVALSLTSVPVPPPPVPAPPPLTHHRCPSGCTKTRHRGTPEHALDLFRYRRRLTSGSVYTDQDMQTFLALHLSMGQLPATSGNTLYILFLPEGVSVTLGSDESCVTYCGYHSSYADTTGTHIVYAVMPFPSCHGCLGELSAFDALTTTTSHEVAEAITDPINGTGWVDNSSGEEIGDLCAWQTRVDGPYTVQKEWSNAYNKCI